MKAISISTNKDLEAKKLVREMANKLK